MLVPFLLAAAMVQPATLRLDYVHSGTASQEEFALDEVIREGPWPGPMSKRVDTSNLGKYCYEVREVGSGAVWYSRGFASIFGEWESTPEAARVRRALQESVRFPEPPGKVRVVLKKRDARNQWKELWQVEVDPKDPAISRVGAARGYPVWPVMKNGAPETKVDLLLLGDGYTAAEMGKWHKDARRLTELLFAQSPFRERKSDFNVWAIDSPSEQSGISQPSDGIWRRSAVRTSYDAFGSERYILTFDNKRLREIASAAPYEFIEIVTNGRKYGGGGIHNLYATVVSDNASTPYIFVHEFGHHFAGLADEYYTSDVAYNPSDARPEPWEPNATADPKAAKWADLIAAGTPLPTPWPKAESEELERDIQKRRREIRAQRLPEERMEALFAEEMEKLMRLYSAAEYRRKVGAFEGAMYEARGYYRPQLDCMMFTRNPVGFCAVCRRAIERVVDQYTAH